jgi:hypothetical protein
MFNRYQIHAIIFLAMAVGMIGYAAIEKILRMMG